MLLFVDFIFFTVFAEMGFDPIQILLFCVFVPKQFLMTWASSNFTQLYHEARIHYLDEQWQETIDSFEELMIKWKTFHQNQLECRQKCKTGISPETDENVLVIEVASCQLNCRIPLICDKIVENDLRRNMPYNYLQLAYYK